MLNTILWDDPLSDNTLWRIRNDDRIEEARRERLGLPRYLAEAPAFGSYGPLRKITDQDRIEIGLESNMHPFGRNKRKYRIQDDDEDVE